nr:hypothetical protein [Flavivirga sp. MEBiC07777]
MKDLTTQENSIVHLVSNMFLEKGISALLQLTSVIYGADYLLKKFTDMISVENI